MVKRIDIALAVSKNDDDPSLMTYEGGYIGESGNFYPFLIKQRYYCVLKK